MTRWQLLAAIAALAVSTGSLPALAGLGEAAELAAARANARAGGPTSERDRELLERYGCLSGTDNPVCGRSQVREPRNSHRRKRPRHNDE